MGKQTLVTADLENIKYTQGQINSLYAILDLYTEETLGD